MFILFITLLLICFKFKAYTACTAYVHCTYQAHYMLHLFLLILGNGYDYGGYEIWVSLNLIHVRMAITKLGSSQVETVHTYFHPICCCCSACGFCCDLQKEAFVARLEMQHLCETTLFFLFIILEIGLCLPHHIQQY